MRLSLSTNYFKADTPVAARIDQALSMGFGELELGYGTTLEEAAEYRRLSGRIAIGSVHAFAPVPISAPSGHPELYAWASPDPEARRIARFNVFKCVDFAADMGADTLVLHLGRVPARGFWPWGDKVRARLRHGRRMLETMKTEFAEAMPQLEKRRVVLGLENMPYLEGFPMTDEWSALSEFSAWIKPWFDTGHWRVQECNRWVGPFLETAYSRLEFAGMHLNDVKDFNDDHFAPGGGKVDFKALKAFMAKVPHVVFEPKSHVSEQSLRQGVEIINDAIS
ncbi:MAG: sugar phosphate isomerase/epimerase [Kiritimatiellae bacterium]|nr:sugar phosphate isomerase/epimerase [Kiritimatiellia bacterium]